MNLANYLNSTCNFELVTCTFKRTQPSTYVQHVLYSYRAWYLKKGGHKKMLLDGFVVFKNVYLIVVVILQVFTFLYITILILALTTAYPSKENLKIRIHIPVKHHTHVHTKTLVKKVPLPVPIHVKKHHEEYKIKHSVEELEDDFEGYDYPKKKRRTRHPFV